MNDATPKKKMSVGAITCFSLAALVFCIDPTLGIILAPGITLAWCMFRSKRRFLQWGAWGFIVSLTPQAVYLAWVADGIASSDAQGGLIYIFGPLYMAPICLGCTLLCMAITPLWNALKPLNAEEKGDSSNGSPPAPRP